MDKTALIEQMKIVLATVFAMYLKSHNYHWNVTGANFIQYHEFLGDVYTQLHDSVDVYAEHIRALGSFTPGSFSRFSELSKIGEELLIPKGSAMFMKLSMDNVILQSELRIARARAEQAGEFGVVNFLEGEIDAHDKLQWKLDAFKEII